MTDVRERGQKGWEVDETGSGSYPVAGFCISSAEHSGYSTIDLVACFSGRAFNEPYASRSVTKSAFNFHLSRTLTTVHSRP